MSTLEVANTIKNQLGNKALAMLGANYLAGDEKSLQFRISGCRKYNSIRIEVNSLDLYNVSFYKIAKYDVKDQLTIENVYADTLHDIIEKNTSLYLSL